MAKKEVKENKNKTSFLKGLKAELKKVVWPTPKQLFNSTVAVIAIVLITTLIVFILDVTFETINKQGIDRIKNLVVNNTVETTNTTDENNTSENTNNATVENSTSENTTNTTVENNTTNENNEANNSKTENNTNTNNSSKK